MDLITAEDWFGGVELGAECVSVCVCVEGKLSVFGWEFTYH